MSRMMDAFHTCRAATSSPCRQFPDSDPVLLLNETDEQTATPTAAVPASNIPEGSAPTADEPVAFIEIPETDASGAASPSQSPARQVSACLRFAPNRQSYDWPGRDGEASALLADLDAQARAWHPELEKFGQEIRRLCIRHALLICALPPSRSRESILTVAWSLLAVARPLILVELPPALGLHSLLGRDPVPGWTDWLASLPLSCVVQSTPHPDWHYLAPGHQLAWVRNRLFAHDWKTLLSKLTSDFSLTLFVANTASPWSFPLALVTDAVAFLLSEDGKDLLQDSRALAIQACANRSLGYLFIE
ncbi:hypothetical protein HRbin36_00020 [bacterium HR36]|nr:hypothetical protein HRbin36_00020 [bacterium HR36]